MPDLPSITRRIFLKSTPAAIAVVSAPVPAAATTLTPVERFEAAVAELKASAEALDPSISRWTVNSNGDLGCGLLVAAFRNTTKYEGDGWYKGPPGSPTERIVYVERTPEHDRDGERWFRITPKNRAPFVMSEQFFFAGYGKKIST